MAAGAAVVNLARVVPDGLLVFFPSYVVLQSCIEAWKAGSTYERLLRYKAVVRCQSRMSPHLRQTDLICERV